MQLAATLRSEKGPLVLRTYLSVWVPFNFQPFFQFLCYHATSENAIPDDKNYCTFDVFFTNVIFHQQKPVILADAA
jgi:hypothetical protein